MKAFILLLLLPCFLVEASEFDPEAYEEASKYLLQSLNTNSKPCENFFDHVCGKYPWRTNDTHERVHPNLAKDFLQLAIDLIKEINVESDSTAHYYKNLKVYFDQCLSMNESIQWRKELIESIASRLAIRDWFDKLDENTTDAAEAWRLSGRMKRWFGAYTLSQVLLMEGPSALIRFTYLENCDTLENRTTLIASDLASIFPEKDIERLLQAHFPKVHALREDIMQASRTESDANSRLIFNGGSWSEEVPNFDFDSYLEGVIPDEMAREGFLNRVRVFSLKYMEYQGRVLKRHSIHTFRLMALYLLYEKLGALRPQAIIDDEFCYGQAKARFAPVIAKLILNHHKRDRASLDFAFRKFARNILSAFRFLLNTFDWIDDENRERIQDAVDMITIDTGLPAWLDDEGEIARRTPSTYDRNASFFENAFVGIERSFEYVIETINEGRFVAEPQRWEDKEYPTLTFDAWHLSTDYLLVNLGPKLHFHFPYTLPPIFNDKYPTAILYGGIGAIMGHELLHMFSPTLRPDWDLTGRPLLKDKAMIEYKRKLDCLATDFSRYCTFDDKYCILGNLTLKENIPDIGGLKAAYLAYKILATVGEEDPRAPGLLEYTNDQLFFMAHARFWCERGYSPEEYQTDVHAPNIARVEVAYRHVRAFAGAFGCPLGSKYVPQKECGILGDIEGPNLHDLNKTKLGKKGAN